MLTALLLVTLAAPGDVEAILATPRVELDGPAKSTLATAILGVFPNAVTATIQNYYCRRDVENEDQARQNDVICSGFYTTRVTTAEFVDLSIANLVRKTLPGAPEGFVDIWKGAPQTIANTDGKTKTAAFVTQVFTGIAINDIKDFACQRDQNDITKVVCRCAYYDEVSPVTYVTLAHAGFVVKALRKIP
ncbi:MAG: hypothetical protein ACXADY_25210 [Candidatus Hodarchaeales archaeon]|jgi:hypothetical protein